jgi:hypothetical protein
LADLVAAEEGIAVVRQSIVSLPGKEFTFAKIGDLKDINPIVGSSSDEDKEFKNYLVF